jgi:hypothetical protein
MALPKNCPVRPAYWASGTFAQKIPRRKVGRNDTILHPQHPESEVLYVAGFLKAQWRDIAGNVKFWAISAVLAGLVTLFTLLTHGLTLWQQGGLIALFCVIAAWATVASILAIKPSWKTPVQESSAKEQSSAASAIAQVPAQFDPDILIKTSYNSALLEETKNNLRLGFSAIPAEGREEYFINWMAHGVLNYVYDILWAQIYRSQLLMLQELNLNVLPLDKAQAFYDTAKQQYPNEYANYSFDQWLGFMLKQTMLNQQGTQIGITERGRDFLKFIIHLGRSIDAKKF